MTNRQLTALLSVPASLRPILIAASATSPPALQTRCFHATCRDFARYLKRPLSVGAFTVPHSPTLPLSEISIKELLESPKPDKSLADELRSLFTKNPATFYHGTSDFYELKKNTRIPEICILGRSNVGKSTFVNALANRREHELAHTSARAGRTKAMNAFGFGPAPTIKELADADPETKRTEDLPKHTFFVLDMPGYGHRSLQDWGKHINLYLNKRKAIKGAILLIDGEVGPKNGDLMALELLQAAGLKTAIVLTKADKARHEEILKNTCRDMWMNMRDIHASDPNSKWEWERDFFVTALGATKKEIGVETVAIARLAVARLAGLIREKERPETDATKGYSGDIVSFDELQFAPTVTKSSGRPASAPSEVPQPTYAFTALEQAARDQHQARMAASQPPGSTANRQLGKSASERTTPNSKPSNSAFGALEQASSEQKRTSSGSGRLSRSSSAWSAASNPRRPRARPLRVSGRPYSQARSLKTLPGRKDLSADELEAVLKEFTSKLKVNLTPLDIAAEGRVNSMRDRPKPKIWNPMFMPKDGKEPSKQELKATKARHAEIYQARLEREQIRAYREEERQKFRDTNAKTHERVSARKSRDSVRNNTGDEGPDAADLAQSWSQIEAAQERREKALRGKKLKKAQRDEEKKARREEKHKKQRKELDVDEDEFAAKFNAAR